MRPPLPTIRHMNRIHMLISAALALAIVAWALAHERHQPPPAGGAGGAGNGAVAIPADAEHAADALKNSPRHGEWVDINVPAAGAGAAAVKLKTWVVYPERSEKAPIVLVIHEIFGLTDWMRAVADQLAADGFIAVAPDLLSGKGPDGGGTDSLGEKVREVIRTITPDEQARLLNAARDYALALPASSGKSASIGFCWGGSASFNYAVHQPKLNAAVVYYGTAPQTKDGQDSSPDTDAFAKIACPVLGLYGGDDARVTSTVESTATAMKAAGKSFTQHTYEGAGHGFLRQQTGKDGANLRAAQAAWRATIEFLRDNTRQ
jgi:carboxymethylenebutenolidase